MKKIIRPLMVVSYLLFSNFNSMAQTPCDNTNTININTGVDALGSVVPYSPAGAPDPFWTISAQTSTVPAGVAIGSPAIITTNSAMPTSSVSNLISYSAMGGTTGYLTTPNNTTFGFFSLTFRRTFQTCVDDSLQFDLNLAFDNYLVEILIDGVPIPGATTSPFTSAPTYYTFGNIYNDNRFLSAGTHTLDVRIGNQYASYSGNPTSLIIVGSITGTTNSIVANSSSQDCACYTPPACSDTCYWKVTGNNILGGNNIFGTLTNDDVKLLTNNTSRGIYTNTGNFGWNTMAPTSKLHVDVTGLGYTGGIRFEGLPSGQDNSVLTVDPLGNVHQMPLPGSGSIVNNCAAIDFIPKTVSPTGDLDCSQIYDDGTSVGIGTTGPFGYMGSMIVGTPPPIGALMALDVNGMVRTTTLVVTSDANFKKNVTPLSNSLEKVLSLRAVEYNWKSQEFPNKRFDNLKHSGFLAQDLMKVLPNSVIKDVTGEYAVDYLSIIPVLTQAIQEQQKQIDELKAIIKNSGASTNSYALKNDGYLSQNVPNPFSVSTVIKYELPKGTQKGAIGVYDMNGREVKLFQLSNEKNGSVTINGGDLMPGMYLYTLIINGQHFDSKKMILTSQ